jgi:hypothetical protein
MLSMYGADEVLRSLYRLARLQSPDAKIQTSEDVRKHYLAFLASKQPHAPVNWSDDVFVDDVATEDKLSAAFSEGLLNDLGQADVVGPSFFGEIRKRKLDLAQQSLEKVLGLDDDFCLIFGLVIHSVFLRGSKPSAGSRGSHGGSSSAAIGTIWLTVEDSLRPVDLMEMFIHELTHHLLFVDELNYKQFEYPAIAKPENFARSAILKRSRPLDKVVHSIVVAAEVLEARRRYLHDCGPCKIHPSSDALKTDTRLAIESVLSLSNLDDLISPRVRQMLERCDHVCAESAN